ncbi:MAG TPA: MSMEG_0565 family glycosyltransferase [Ideonella sp.]|nr:MSMEG_0565 family glycosyltransferase [Ideonella sp.]
MREPPLQGAPLRVALLTHSVNPRGGVVHTLELASALHAAGHRVTVMAPAAPGQRLFRELPCELVLIPVPTAPRDVAAMVGERIAACAAFLRANVRGSDFDVWHAQDSITGNVLAVLRDEGRLAGFARTVHHLDPFDDPRLALWQQCAFAEARQVLCVSRLWQHTLRDVHGVEAALVPNGVDLQRYSPRATPQDAAVALAHGLRPGTPVFLSVGGIEERKNTLRQLEAFIALRHELPTAQLVIAGGASLLDHDAHGARFHALLRASGLAHDAVRLTGPLSHADMPSLFRLADALLMPSLREGFGLVVLEALASGTPAVVSRIAPFTEHLQGTAQLAWADPTDAGSIARAMREALALPDFQEPPAVCRQHGWARSAECHAALYRAGLAVAAAEPDRALCHLTD